MDANLNGCLNIVTLGYAADDLVDNSGYNCVSFDSSGSSLTASDDTVNVAEGISASVAGNNNDITAGGQSTLTLSGLNDEAQVGDGSEIDLTSGDSGITIYASDVTVNMLTNAAVQDLWEQRPDRGQFRQHFDFRKRRWNDRFG